MSVGPHGIADDWSILEPELDVLLELAPAPREAALQKLVASHPALAMRLRQLLSADEAAAAAGFLETLPSSPLADAPAERAHEAGERIGPWRLLSPLGRGGMAEVWLARRDDGQLEREVALKLPLPTCADGRMAERFRRERDILAALVHPHIARLYDAGVDARGRSWLALEYVRGEDLLASCARQGLDIGARLRLFLQVCEAVQYAHGRLVIHRDLKPANVLVDEQGQVRLLDFGIARLLDDGEPGALTALTGRPLTLEYASPEQVEGELPGIASDIYGLGVLLYRLLCGASPYQVETSGRRALERTILTQVPRPPSQRVEDASLRRRLHGDLDTIIGKALAKAPSLRYPTVDALAADLRRHLQGEPVQARPPSLAYRMSRFVARHRLGVSLAALAVVALLATTGVALHQAALARREVARTQALYQFVLGLFNPDNKPIPDTRYRDMPARELVAQGAERVVTSLPDQPQARFQLMHDLAALTTSLGLSEAAARLHAARVAQSLALMGEHSPEYADALLDRTSDLEGQGRYPDAYHDAQRALAIYQAAGERDPDRLARAHYQVAAFGMHSHAAGDPDDLKHLQQAAALWRGRYGKSEFGSVMERLTQYYLLMGRDEDAYRAAREGMENNRRQFGERDWKTAAAEEQTGLMLGNLLRPAEAEPLLRQALATQRAIWGDDHFLVARSRMYLGNLLAASSRHEEASALLGQAYAAIHAPQWQGNKVVLSGFIDQAAIGLDLRYGDQAAALPLCMPYYQALPPLQAAVHLKLALDCAEVATVARRDTDALRLLDDAARTVAANWPNEPARLAPVWRRRGEIEALHGDRDGARRAFAQALQTADADDLDTLSSAWLGLARADTQPLDGGQRQRLLQLLARVESPAGRDYYLLYAQRLRQALALPAS
jgi:eukaryotic-like serine/threonine-protein kinase